MERQLHWRPILGFIGFDIATYLVLYVLVLPPLEPATQAMDPILSEATGYLLTALRLGFIGAITARWIRNKHGLLKRSDAVPSMVVAAVISWLIHMLLNLFADMAFGGWGWDWGYLLALGQWVVFSLIGALFVSAGQAEEKQQSVPLRFSLESERGAASLFLIPTVSLLVIASLTVIVMLGSATNNRRSADTAADAAALAAGKVWKDTLHGKFSSALSATEGHDFWGLVGTSLAYGLPYDAMKSAAADYAYRNDAELVSFTVDEYRAAIQVKVRHIDSRATGSKDIYSTAEGSLLFRSGLCNEWGKIGFKINGSCVTSPPPEPPAPEPDDEDEAEGEEPEEPPFELPTGLSNWNVDVVLTDAG